MKLVILITPQIEKGLDIAQAWQSIGLPRVTIVRSHDLHLLQEELQSGSVEVPRVMPSIGAAMAAIIDTMDERSEIILSVVADEQVDGVIAAANRVLGDLTAPDSGLLITLPVERVIGLP